jgi:hypothetical protein
VQKRQIRLHLAHHGWVPGIAIGPRTDLESEAVASEILDRCSLVFAQIDAEGAS